MINLTINAVIVTYNRYELLKETIEALLHQTYVLKKIIIVNNASTDGTTEYLNSLSDERIIIKHLDSNIGGAGGFYHGIGIAYHEKCDFVWIMDDDCICSENSLEKLIDAFRLISKNPERKVGFLSSDVRFTNGDPCLMNISSPAYIYNEFLKQGIVQVTHTSFVAMLIPSYVIADVGLPYKEYFIWGDDGEYSTRILMRYLGYVVGQSVVTHKMKENKGVNIFDTPPERIGRFYYFYRNWMFTRMSRNKKDGLKCLLGNMHIIMKLLKSKNGNRKEKIITVSKGTIDGMRFNAKIDSVYDYETKYYGEN